MEDYKNGGEKMARIDLSDTLQTPFSMVSKKVDLLIPPSVAFILNLLLEIAMRRVIIRPYYFGMGGSKIGWFTFELLNFIISFLILAWISAMFDDLLNGRETSLKDSWNRISTNFGNILIVSLLISVIVALGFILYVIPGVIIGVILTPVIPIMVKKNLNIQDSMKEATNFVFQDGNFWFLLVIYVITLLIGLIPYIGTAVSGFLFTLWASYACVKFS